MVKARYTEKFCPAANGPGRTISDGDGVGAGGVAEGVDVGDD